MLNNTFDIKKNIQFFLQNYKTRQSALNGNEGFTLIELLVATAIMTVVMGIVGVGLVAMLNQNKKAASESDRRANLNRALDYISNEVRMAKSVTAPDATLIPSGAKGVLQLTIPVPCTSNQNYTVVYYTYDSSGLWQLPKSIKRYSNLTTPVPSPNPCPNPTNLTPSPIPTPFTDDSKYFLVDAITNPSPLPTPSSSPSPNPCTISPSPSPSPSSASSGEGFYACIYPDGRKVDLYLGLAE